MRHLALLSVVLFVLSACAPSFVERPTQVVLDPGSDDFWARPLPSDLRRQPDGTFDLERWPGDWDNELLPMWLLAADRRMDGWGLVSGAFLPLTGAVDESTLPQSPAASRSGDASVFLVDIDEASPERGQRLPVRVRTLMKGDVYTRDHLLAVLPVFGFVRRPSTRYAVVVTDGVRDASGEPLGRSRAFHHALFGTAEADERTREHLAPLAAWLDEEGIPREAVVGAAVFTTFDPNVDLKRLARFYEELPAPSLSEPWSVVEEHESYVVLEGRYEVPLVQSGTRPYTRFGDGHIVWDDDGRPVEQERQGVRLALTVPKSPMPADGFPLTLTMHGSGGDYRMNVDRGPRPEVENQDVAAAPGTGPAEWLARRGVATLGFDFPLHGDRNTPPDTTGLLLYNLLGNIEATLDNFTVAAAEVTYLSRFVEGATVDASLSPLLDAGGAADGLIRFDGSRLTALGQSMGSTLGVAVATVDPRIDGYMFSGAGGVLVEIAATSTQPFEFRGVLETVLGFGPDEDLHIDHPLLHTLQHVWDLVDPVAKARHVVLEPHEGRSPPAVMMSAGVIDGYFNPRSEAALAVALGVEHVGAAVEPVLPETLALAGLGTTLPYPLHRNVSQTTAGVVQYEAPFRLGHYVVFNQEGARHQYTCFLASVGTAAGARIPAAETGFDDCP